MSRRMKHSMLLGTLLLLSGMSPAHAGPWTREACSLPTSWLRRIDAGYRGDRSGELQIVPVQGNYFDNHSHAGPWPYLQEIPMFLYGPGHVEAAGMVDTPVTMADLAPTIGEHLEFPFDTQHGRSMGHVTTGSNPPRVFVVVVWDGGGRNVLARFPNAWPNLRSLRPEGAWFDRATVGSSPSTTAAVHSTLGTGVYARIHGVVDRAFRVRNRIRTLRDSLSFLDARTIGDRFDLDQGNEPVVGMVGNTLALGMLGHGGTVEGADRDFLLTHGPTGRWTIRTEFRPHFLFPDWVGQIPGPRPRPHLSSQPRFARYQTRIVEELIRREGFGDDDIPDLLFVNYKLIDHAGHPYGAYSRQMREALAASDAAFGRLVEILDAEVGSGRWALALTADHGSTPDAGFSISRKELERDIEARFDRDGDARSVVDKMGATQIYLDLPELRDNGAGPKAVATFVKRYRKGQNRSGGGRGRAFRSVFPSSVLRPTLPCLSA
jgi:Type I phosphodiesterase / nucleotide pyrophosphatase